MMKISLEDHVKYALFLREIQAKISNTICSGKNVTSRITYHLGKLEKEISAARLKLDGMLLSEYSSKELAQFSLIETIANIYVLKIEDINKFEYPFARSKHFVFEDKEYISNVLSSLYDFCYENANNVHSPLWKLKEQTFKRRSKILAHF